MKMNHLINSTSATIRRNGPAVLGGMAIASGIGATFMGVRATFRAVEIIENSQEVEDDIHTVSSYLQHMPKQDILKLVWKEYISTAALLTASVGLTISCMYVQNKRHAALATMYALSETSFKEYKEKVIENVGKGKEQKVRDGIREDKLNSNPVQGKEIVITGSGEHLCYDELSGRYFKSDMESIRGAINAANEKLIGGWNYISLNEVYSLLGLPGIELGRELGWNVDRLPKLEYGSHLASNGEPCLMISFEEPPHSDYY